MFCYIKGDLHIFSEIWNFLFQLGTNNFGDFDAHHPAWGSSFSSRCRNLTYDTTNSQGLNKLNTETAAHLGWPTCPNSAMYVTLTSSYLRQWTTWYPITELQGCDHFPIIISLSTDNRIHNNTSSPFKTSTTIFQFNLNQANWNLFFQIINNDI